MPRGGPWLSRFGEAECRADDEVGAEDELAAGAVIFCLMKCWLAVLRSDKGTSRFCDACLAAGDDVESPEAKGLWVAKCARSSSRLRRPEPRGRPRPREGIIRLGTTKEINVSDQDDVRLV